MCDAGGGGGSGRVEGAGASDGSMAGSATAGNATAGADSSTASHATTRGSGAGSIEAQSGDGEGAASDTGSGVGAGAGTGAGAGAGAGADEVASAGSGLDGEGTGDSPAPLDLAIYRPKRLESDEDIYHERQHLLYCGVHTVNSLLQGDFGPAAAQKEFEDVARAIAQEFDSGAWINPYKNPLGLGNYDASVLVKVLERRGLTMEWVNRSTPTSSIRLDACVGLIVNRTHRKLLGLITGHHWFALRRFETPSGTRFWNLDSGLSAPTAFESDDAVREFCANIIASNGSVMRVCAMPGHHGLPAPSE